MSFQLSIIIIIDGRRDNPMVHELQVIAAVELHVNATYYAQHPVLKAVYGKDQIVIAGRLLSPNRTV